jgi:hypothetical protein
MGKEDAREAIDEDGLDGRVGNPVAEHDVGNPSFEITKDGTDSPSLGGPGGNIRAAGQDAFRGYAALSYQQGDVVTHSYQPGQEGAQVGFDSPDDGGILGRDQDAHEGPRG